MSNPFKSIALMSVQSLPTPSSDGEVPDWVHLLPASTGAISTGDQRGPYHVTDAEEMIAASFQDADRLPIDENHATDLAAPLGNPSPARGWIVEMQARADGIWGRVEWNKAGQELVASKAYRGLSPVILHDKAKNVLRILRASLVNRPNLRGLTALNQESDMTLLERLAELLGLDAASSETDMFNAVSAIKADKGGNATALQAQMSEIGIALGLGQGGDATSILEAAKKAKTGETAEPAVITALQSEIADLTTKLNGVTSATAKAAATAFVDGEIKRGRAGVKPLRDHYISMHMEDAGRVEKEIGALPVLMGSGTHIVPPAPKDGEVALNAEQTTIARQLGLDPKDYANTLAKVQAAEEAL